MANASRVPHNPHGPSSGSIIRVCELFHKLIERSIDVVKSIDETMEEPRPQKAYRQSDLPVPVGAGIHRVEIAEIEAEDQLANDLGVHPEEDVSHREDRVAGSEQANPEEEEPPIVDDGPPEAIEENVDFHCTSVLGA